MRHSQTSALEMDAMTYGKELDRALSSEPTIDSAIGKFPFLEYPAWRSHTILQIDHTKTKGAQWQDAWNFYRWLCDFYDEQSVANWTLKAHSKARAQLQQ